MTTETKEGINMLALAGIGIALLIGIIFGIIFFAGGEDSATNIGGGITAAGNQPAVQNSQNSQGLINSPNNTQAQPNTQTQTQTQPKKTSKTKRILPVKTGETLTPSEKVALEFLTALQQEDYSTAVKYVDESYLKKLQGFFGGKTDEEILYIATKRAPEYYGPDTSEIKILSERRSYKEKWSVKKNKPVKYETAGVNFEVYSTKKNKRISRNIDLEKEDGVWKITKIGGL